MATAVAAKKRERQRENPFFFFFFFLSFFLSSSSSEAVKGGCWGSVAESPCCSFLFTSLLALFNLLLYPQMLIFSCRLREEERTHTHTHTLKHVGQHNGNEITKL